MCRLWLFFAAFKIAAMIVLQGLRQHRAVRVARFMLVWFALSLGAAIASPLLNPQSTELICTGTGVMKLLVKSDDGSGSEVASRMLDCPLCATLAAPPPADNIGTQAPRFSGCVLQTARAANHVVRTAAPLLARGPPVFS